MEVKQARIRNEKENVQLVHNDEKMGNKTPT
jgi:hypothetical protein